MANTIVVKRSSVAGKVPTAGDLQVGELAVNLTDRKIYSKDSSGTVVQLGGGAGAGDVVGPSSATANALARYDGTTGKLIKNGAITEDDNGTLAGVNGLSLNTSPTSPPTSQGSIAWDTGDGTPYVILNANTSLQLGQENVAKVYNGTGATINKGQVVAVSGAQGQRPSVVLADADTEALSAPTLGLAAEAIANGAEGFVCTFGLVRGIDTSAFTAGQPIYLSSTVGAFTATKPVAPQHIVSLGWVVKVNASSGEVFININNGWELDELHNVLINTPASGNTLIYDAVAGVWKNASLTAGTGISITNGAGSITVTNSAPDQTVALTGAGATTISGSYPNFTISSVNTTYSAATSTVAGLIELASDTVQSTAANAVTTTANRSYGLQVNAAGQGVVNVPWTDTVYTLPAATSTVLGGIELGSDTVQSTAANAVTSTASRTYALQVNAAGQGVVNVPWTDTNSGGTVTSVGGTGTVSGLTLTGTVTTSGNLTLGGTLSVTPSNFASQTANTVLAAPNGAAGTPTFRALVAADIPTLNQNTTGTASNVTGTVAVANGGTGATTAAGALTNLGAYAASNPSGYTSNTGTVTSVSGTGSYGGLTLSGTVTTSGNLTLGGTPTGTWPISVSGNAATASSTPYPAFSGDSVGKDDITTRTDSGFYETSSGTTAEGWPVNDGSWQHMIASTHSNDANYYSMQIGGSFYDNVFYGRKTNGSGTTAWVQFLTTGTTVAIANGGTGATTAANALTNLGAYPSSNPSGYTSNTGTVTSVATGTGLTGGTITTSGTISLANTAVTAGSYTNANITVDAQGRITAASSGAGGGVTSFSAGTTGLTPSTGTTGAVTLAGTLAVANGGTGATTAAGARTNLGISQPIGDGQTWTNVTASRANGTTYTNSTGRPIAVALSCWSSNNTGYFYINGSNVYLGLGRATYFNVLPLFMIVPAGATYSTSGLDYIGLWMELR